jgi:hypothetical protein
MRRIGSTKYHPGVRSRPRVKLYYGSEKAMPGAKARVELLVESKSETPVEFIATRLVGVESVLVGAGDYRSVQSVPVVTREAREKARLLPPGTHRYRYTFELPANAPPSYSGSTCSVRYTLSVHVSVPWWPDRRAEFSLPVAPRPSPLPIGGEARIVASANGPQAGRVYAEVSIDRDVLEPGGAVSGAVSVSNTLAHRVRRVLLSLIAVERIGGPNPAVASSVFRSAVLVEGPPPEGEPVPFQFPIPDRTAPTFKARSFALDWQLSVRVDVAFGEDTIVTIPLAVTHTPAGTAPRAPGRYHPVGRDRFGRLWRGIADQFGMTLDDDGQTLRSSRADASLAVRRVHDGKGHALRVELAWPTLGIDLHVTERSWTDLGASGWSSPSINSSDRLVIRGREPEQLSALFDTPLVEVLAGYSGVSIDDDHATLTLPIAGTSAPELEQACRSALWLLSRVATWTGCVPPPRTLSAAVDPWRAFAAKLQGVLVVGSLSARDCAIGGERLSVETYWAGPDEALATSVTFPLDPPLDTEPDEDDPSLSAAARELLVALKAQASNLQVTRQEVSWREPEAAKDPAGLLPCIELAVRLIRALRGGAPAGPYR